MTFQEARAELAEISQGAYRAIRYEMTDKGVGISFARCTVYIHGQDNHSAACWREALDSMREAIGVDEKQAPGPSEAPVMGGATT